MNFEKIRADYNDFFIGINTAHSILYHLICVLYKFLEEYKKDSYDEIFTDNIEINLANLECIFYTIDNVVELMENITLLETKLPTNHNTKIYNFYDYLKILDDYEQDIYIDINHVNLSELWKKTKYKFRLYKNDELNNNK